MLSYIDGAGKDSLTDLAVEAARKALEMAEVEPDEVDLVLMCTSTPEDLFGSAPQVYSRYYSIVITLLIIDVGSIDFYNRLW